MNRLVFVVLSFIVGVSNSSQAKVTSETKELVVLQPGDLPELSQRPGESMELHNLGNGSTYLYLEQFQAARMVILDVTDTSQIKTVGSIKLYSSAPFDFVRDLDDSTALVCFRNNQGAAIVDLRHPKDPTVVKAELLNQAAHAEQIGQRGILMVNEPRSDGDMPVHDYQIVDASNPRTPKLLATVTKVQKRLVDPATGAMFLLGSDGLTVVRRPQLEEEHRAESNYN